MVSLPAGIVSAVIGALITLYIFGKLTIEYRAKRQLSREPHRDLDHDLQERIDALYIGRATLRESGSPDKLETLDEHVDDVVAAARWLQELRDDGAETDPGEQALTDAERGAVAFLEACGVDFPAA